MHALKNVKGPFSQQQVTNENCWGRRGAGRKEVVNVGKVAEQVEVERLMQCSAGLCIWPGRVEAMWRRSGWRTCCKEQARCFDAAFGFGFKRPPRLARTLVFSTSGSEPVFFRTQREKDNKRTVPPCRVNCAGKVAREKK